MNFLFDDEVKDIANSYDCVLLPAGNRSRKVQWEVPRKSNGWAYGFGRAMCGMQVKKIVGYKIILRD